MVNPILISTGFSTLLAYQVTDLSRTNNAAVVVRQVTGDTLDPSQFPSQCQTPCSNIIKSINTCDSDSCICTSANANGMENCVNCLINIAPNSSSLRSEGQSLVDEFNTDCSSFNLPTVTISGSSSATTGTGTASRSTTATTNTTASISGLGSSPIPTRGSSSGSSGGSPSGSGSSGSGSGAGLGGSNSGFIGDNGALSMRGGFAGLVVSLGAVVVAAYLL